MTNFEIITELTKAYIEAKVGDKFVPDKPEDYNDRIITFMKAVHKTLCELEAFEVGKVSEHPYDKIKAS